MTRVSTVAALCSLIAMAPAAAAPAAAAPPDPLSVDALLADVAHYVELGPEHHLTGTPSGRRTSAWVAAEFERAGLAVTRQDFTYLGFFPDQVELRAGGERVPGAVALKYSGLTSPVGVSGELVDVGLGTPPEIAMADVAGKIALVYAPSAGRGATLTLDGAYESLVDAGAAGAVFATDGPQDLPVHSNTDSRAGVHGMPAVIVGKHTGARLREAAGGPVDLVLRARVGETCVGNVVGFLPGASARTIVVATPLHAHSPSASERGPGVAALLALARHYAALPEEERPVTLVFAGLDGHEVGFLGLPILMQADWFEDVEAYVHIGASLAARAGFETHAGDTVISDAPEPVRVLALSENPLLEPIRAMFAPTQVAVTVPPAVTMPGEPNFSYAGAIPTVTATGSSHPFHTAADVMEWVQPEMLPFIVEAYLQTIDYLNALPEGAVGSTNTVPSIVGPARGPYGTHPLAPPVEEPEHEAKLGCAAAGSGPTGGGIRRPPSIS